MVLIHRDHTIYWIGEKNNRHIDHFEPFRFLPTDHYFDSEWSNMACLLVRREIFDLIKYDGINPKTGKVHKHYSADNFFGRRVRYDLGKEQIVRKDVWLYHYNERVRIRKQDLKRTKFGR